MFYKYTVTYKSGSKMSGYAMSEKSPSEVRGEIERRLFGSYKLFLQKYGEDFPPINSDYILTV